MVNSDESHIAGVWDVYWRGTKENSAHQQGGPQDQVLETYWCNLFSACAKQVQPLKVLDLACGNGAVTGYAFSVLEQLDICCLDYSVSAVSELQQRYPEARCVAGDASHLPFGDGSFDIVASQFGIEYAGAESIEMAVHLLAPHGVLAAVLHLRDGGIYRECAGNLQAVQSIQDSNLMPLARKVFNAGFDLNAHLCSVEAFRQIEREFVPAVRHLEGIIKDSGPGVATGLLRKLYDDIAHMYQRMSAYGRKDIIDWVDGMVDQLDAYAGRMSSMLDCALDVVNVGRLRLNLEKQGLTVRTCRPMVMGSSVEAAAWLLEGQRQ